MENQPKIVKLRVNPRPETTVQHRLRDNRVYLQGRAADAIDGVVLEQVREGGVACKVWRT